MLPLMLSVVDHEVLSKNGREILWYIDTFTLLLGNFLQGGTGKPHPCHTFSYSIRSLVMLNHGYFMPQPH
jgi:hypothetical protein